MSTAYIYRDPTSSTGVQKATFSFWCKRNKLTAGQYIFFNGFQSNYGSYNFYIKWHSDDTIKIINDDGGVNFKIVTNRLFRDPNAWYHVYLALDLTQSGTDRGKLYINGVRETSFSSETTMSGDQFLTGKTGYRSFINRSPNATSEMGGYCLSHCYYIDGYIVDVGQFGSTDTSTGEWKINTSPTIANYGTNGFLIFKDDKTITDQSSGSNDWTLAQGTLTKTEDCPSNVFATFNANNTYFVGGTGSNGNTTWQTNNSQYSSIDTTLGASSGKYYWEFKCSARTSGDYWHIGIKSAQDTASSHHLGYYATDYAYQSYNGNRQNNNTGVSYGATYTIGDIIGVAMDLDNNRLFFSKNGTWQDSGDPTSSTGAITITDPASTPFGFYIPAFSFNDGSGNGTIQANFGNGYFGSTQISSAGTNASGNGIFEYDVPTGYTALSTKGLNL